MTAVPHVIHCCDLNDYEQKIQPLLDSKDKWIFRGQKDASWPLSTTLERACQRFGVKGPKREAIEKRMIREFKRRLHQYTANVPGEDQLDEWMALMQHHGSPTRLLDFTYSPYVAAYFAFEAADYDGNVAIWAVNTNWCERELEAQFPSLARPYLSYQKHRREGDFNTLFTFPPTREFVLSVTPFRLSERLAYQRGAFMCPRDVTVGFSDSRITCQNLPNDPDCRRKRQGE